MTVYQLAVPYPVLPVSDVEKQAIDELMPKLDSTKCEEKAAKLKADATLMFDKKIEPTEVPEFVRRSVEREQAQLEAQIAALKKRGAA
jgi:hypothetical protein